MSENNSALELSFFASEVELCTNDILILEEMFI